MKIGIWVNEPLSKNSGGGFTYFNTLMAGIDDFDFGPEIEIILLSAHDIAGFSKLSINIKPYRRELSFFAKFYRKCLKIISKNAFSSQIDFLDQKEKKIKDRSTTDYLKKQGIKIIFYPLPSSAIFEGIPYIVNNWDLAHHSAWSFPEFVDERGFQRRDEWYRNVVPSALFTFCESEAGRSEIVQYLNINTAKIKVLPIFCSKTFVDLNVPAPEQQQFIEALGLTAGKFFFYPAQFWAHKNHFHLVGAFSKFVKLHPEYKLLFCGSDKGNIDYIKTKVKAAGLEQNIVFGGFIEDSALFTLYKNASALVMPTFLGPTNIPLIEALFLGCPALLSDIDGHREIMGNAAFYFNPLDDDSIVESMKTVIDESTREQIMQNQKDRSKITDNTIEKVLIMLEAHFLEAIKIRSCWE